MYYVMMSHNFDAEIYLYECEIYEMAKDLLQYSWEQYYNIELLEGNSNLYETECYHEDEYAKIEWGDGDITEWNLICGLDAIPDDFMKQWKRKEREKTLKEMKERGVLNESN